MMRYLTDPNIEVASFVIFLTMILVLFIIIVLDAITIRLLDKKLYHPYQELWKNSKSLVSGVGNDKVSKILRHVKYMGIYCVPWSDLRKKNKKLYMLMVKDLTLLEKRMLVTGQLLLIFMGLFLFFPMLWGAVFGLPHPWHEIYGIDGLRLELAKKFSFFTQLFQ